MLTQYRVFNRGWTHTRLAIHGWLHGQPQRLVFFDRRHGRTRSLAPPSWHPMRSQGHQLPGSIVSCHRRGVNVAKVAVNRFCLALTSLVGLGSRELCPYRITAYETAVKAEKRLRFVPCKCSKMCIFAVIKGADNAPDVKL